MIYQAICPNRARDAARRVMSGRSTPLVWIESIDAQCGRNPEGGDAKQGSVEDEHAVPPSAGCAQPSGEPQ